jgi:hypothetical protein
LDVHESARASERLKAFAFGCSKRLHLAAQSVCIWLLKAFCIWLLKAFAFGCSKRLHLAAQHASERDST